uniref:Uncharacterized protein n=1 Tax=Arundo donax TaxID=35708 RepID=A0A0A9FAQ1_ARUDO
MTLRLSLMRLYCSGRTGCGLKGMIGGQLFWSRQPW